MPLKNICTTKVYLFSKRMRCNILKWEKCKDKVLVWHMVGEMVKKCCISRFLQGCIFLVIIPAVV